MIVWGYLTSWFVITSTVVMLRLEGDDKKVMLCGDGCDGCDVVMIVTLHYLPSTILDHTIVCHSLDPIETMIFVDQPKLQ